VNNTLVATSFAFHTFGVEPKNHHKSMIRVGIFFGGSSREREVSFAGGRTVYDNLDKNMFEAVPIFVDSFNNFIELDWKYIYKGSIRDFYPTIDSLRKFKFPIQHYAESITECVKDGGISMAKKLGKVLRAEDLKTRIDIAFLALHGEFGEDGTIQGLLEWMKIPYTGSGILPSAIGMNKAQQKNWMKAAGFAVPKFANISRTEWIHGNTKSIYKKTLEAVGKNFVVKPANQGSSVGVSVLKHPEFNVFTKSIDKSFFIQRILSKEWNALSNDGKFLFIQQLSDLRDGIGLPCKAGSKVLYHADELIQYLNREMKNSSEITLEGIHTESDCLIESFIEGREFSCIVIRNEDGNPVALPPTEIIKGQNMYDYRSKYLPGLSRKITPIDLPVKKIEEIRSHCVELYQYFKFNVYARIDGFVHTDGTIYLNDPNTTSGMMPSSFFFHQASEIGLNPSQFISYIIHATLKEQLERHPTSIKLQFLFEKLEKLRLAQHKNKNGKKRVAVMMGGYSTERHISVESGRNIYEKLASSPNYTPFPVFVTGNDQKHTLHLIPINVMLKDNADDIKEKTANYKPHPILKKIASECAKIRLLFDTGTVISEPKEISYKELTKLCDAVFIALHGRPGEDGTVQRELDKLRIPYNGSGSDSSGVTINKFETNKRLRSKGFLVADHMLVHQADWEATRTGILEKAKKMGYPLIAKPVDDGCSSAVKKIKTDSDLIAYAEAAFRKNIQIPENLTNVLGLKPNEEFPQKKYFLLETLIQKGKASHFLEITGGMITHYRKGKVAYETFEPSEALAEFGILSLEEKFLAGQGQNITPARYATNEKNRLAISKQVQQTLKEVAQCLNVQGYCRIDAFVRVFPKNKCEVIIIEINSLPGMTPATAIFHQCALNGYKPYEFIHQILEFGTQRTKLIKS
jgi:UDP-N-acetylmuramate--alanine ligase